ncbi:hypothetical protein ACEQ8H_000449 [Pleosporales sp. CAS-2024a]
MPRNKAGTPNADTESTGKFTWEGPNDTKLLLLTQGRYVKPDEYPQLASAFPGATQGSIRNRVSALRVKQRNLYEAMGWAVPEGGAAHSAKKKRGADGATPSKKRAVHDDDEHEHEHDEGTPSKRARAPKSRKRVEEEDEDEEGARRGVAEHAGNGVGGRVKEEEEDMGLNMAN